MTDYQTAEYYVELVLKKMGYPIICHQEWINQSEALRILKPKNIGRARLEKMLISYADHRNHEKGKVRFKKDMEVRNATVDINRKDILEILNS